MRFFLVFSAALLLIVAILSLYTGFNLDTMVPSPPDASQYLSGGGQGVANLQLMHVQLLYVIVGLVAGLGSCVLFGAAAIVGAIERFGTGDGVLEHEKHELV